MSVILENFIVNIATPTPRRWTPYRSNSSPSGLTVSAVFYATRHLELPQLREDDSPAPATITLIIGNADNTANDLVTNAANRRAVVTITKVQFDASWNVTGTKLWFIGRLGAPSFEGELVTIECHARRGRTGPSPSKDSSTLMTSHTPPAAGTKQPWFTGS